MLCVLCSSQLTYLLLSCVLCVLCSSQVTYLLTPLLCALCPVFKPSYLLTYSSPVCFVSCVQAKLPTYLLLSCVLCVLCSSQVTYLLTPLLCALCPVFKPSYLLTYSSPVCFVSCVQAKLPTYLLLSCVLCVLCSSQVTYLLTPLLCALCPVFKPSYLLTYSSPLCFVSCVCSTLPGQPSNRRRANLDNGVHPPHGPQSSKAATTMRIQLNPFVVLHDSICPVAAQRT